MAEKPLRAAVDEIADKIRAQAQGGLRCARWPSRTRADRRRAPKRRAAAPKPLPRCYLRLKGYRIAHARYKTPCRRDRHRLPGAAKCIVFVEVKRRTRAANRQRHALEARQHRAASPAPPNGSVERQSRAWQWPDCRFDVIFLAPGRWPRHLINAFWRELTSAETLMPLSVAVQMDPIDAINPLGDSTFALMLEAQARGHKLSYYTPDYAGPARQHK